MVHMGEDGNYWQKFQVNKELIKGEAALGIFEREQTVWRKIRSRACKRPDQAPFWQTPSSAFTKFLDFVK